MSSSSTRFVVLTPPGRAAVASLLVEGPRAVEVVESIVHFHGTPPSRREAGRIALGRVLSAIDGEEVVVCRRAPTQIEIHCHGGIVAVAAIAAALVRHGCHEVAWQTWTLEHETDSFAAEARIALAAATTARTAEVLWDQYTGAIGNALADIAEAARSKDIAEALKRVEHLLASVPLGRHLTEPWRVVFAGRPNVGKSSLINALVGFERAIVHDTPGTTRDVVTAATALDGWPVELADTAGLRAGGNTLETAGMQLAEAQMAVADLVVLVSEASNPWDTEDRSLAARWPDALRVFNKSDLLGDRRATDPLEPGVLLTSATRGLGIDELGREIASRLVPLPPAPGQAVPFTARQQDLLWRVHQSLASGNTIEAIRLLDDAKSRPTGCC